MAVFGLLYNTYIGVVVEYLLNIDGNIRIKTL